MSKSLFALALAFSVLPIRALAQDTSAPPQPTPEQRQAMHQTFEQFGQQEEQLHQQMRYRILSALSSVHQRAVAATIGELAIAPNPDIEGAAKRLDMILSPGERQQVLAAHDAFRTQSMQLHEQMKQQLQSEMPADHPDWMSHGPPNGAMPLDAGTILLMTLTPHPMMQNLLLWRDATVPGR